MFAEFKLTGISDPKLGRQGKNPGKTVKGGSFFGLIQFEAEKYPSRKVDSGSWTYPGRDRRNKYPQDFKGTGLTNKKAKELVMNIPACFGSRTGTNPFERKIPE